MNLKIFFLGFWGDPGFPIKGWIHEILHKDDCTVKNIEDANVLIIGCFLTITEKNLILDFHGKKIIYLTEPIEHFEFSRYTLFLFQNNIYDYAIGLVSNSIEKKHVKNNNPFHTNTFSGISGEYNYKDINHYVKSIETTTKKFCTLINRHDPGNTRRPIHKLLSSLGHIDCPGQLLNNMSNKELNTIGNVKFIQKYIFNICSENFISLSYSGYISEKLLNCCLAGSIPIYYGKLDDDDKKIYNENRIIFIDKDNPIQAYLKVKELLESPNKLEEFYKQDVFMPTAKEECDRQDLNILKLFDALRNYYRRRR